MNVPLKAAVVTAALGLGLIPAAQAGNPVQLKFQIPPLPTYNPNYYLAPGLTVNQYAYNLAVLGRAYQQIPPYALGFNPYPRVLNTGPQVVLPYNYQPTFNPYAGPGYVGTYANPYAAFYP